MMTVKKMLVFTMMITLILGMAAGCGQGETASQTAAKADSGATSTSTAPEKHDPVTVRMMLIAAYNEVFHTYIDPLIKEKYPWITLEYLEAKPALPDLVATGDTPDIVMQNGSLRPVLDLGLQYDMNSLVKKYNFDLTKLDPDLLKSAQAYGEKGELYALPSDRSVRALLYNKDIFDKFNVPYPKDAMKWEEAIALAKRLTRTDGGVQYHGLILGTNVDNMRSEMQLHFFDKNGKANVMSADWQKVAQTWKQLFDIPGNFTKANVRDTFTKDRTAAMIITNSSFLLRNPIPDLNWDYVVAPTFDNGLIQDKLGAMLTIAATSKNKDAAFQVISLYFSDDVQTAIARTASLVSGSNVPEIVKQYGADTPANKGKNLKTDFNGHAVTKVVEQYDNLASPLINSAFVDIATGAKDINTALREAQDKIDQKIAEEKAK
jgi:multiple sugar transport system substrate-binding protein